MKNNLLTDTTALAMHVVAAYLKPGDLAIDATCGNGGDTLELARLVGPTGRVLAFDIQGQAVEATKKRLAEEGVETDVQVIRDSFENMATYLTGTPKAICFNLGYLPGGDKTLTTTAEVTLKGLQTATELVAENGIISVVLYDGHGAGKTEKEQVLAWAKGLDASRFHVGYLSLPNQGNHPPEILFITKKPVKG